jgi:hypothetical protein
MSLPTGRASSGRGGIKALYNGRLSCFFQGFSRFVSINIAAPMQSRLGRTSGDQSAFKEKFF